MRVLASADHHWDLHGRFAETVRVHDWMVDLARKEGVGLFVSAGDIYEGASCPEEREGVAEWLRRMAEDRACLLAKGNHEKNFDLRILARLRTKHPVIVEERAAVHLVAGAAVAAVAWPNRAAIMEIAGRPMTTDGLDAAALEALRDVLRGLGAEMARHDGPRILLGHFMVGGSVASTGQPLLGLPLSVSVEDLALARPHVGILGHIHRRQVFTHEGVPFLYCGSPTRTDFSQLEEKSVTLATFEGARLVGLEHIPTPCAPMAHLAATWTPDGFEYSAGDFALATKAGTETRLRYRVAPEQREAAARDAARFVDELRARGVVVAPPEEEVQVATRARIPELAAASSLAEKMRLLWRSKDQAPDAEREQRLLSGLSQLEQERHEDKATKGDLYSAASTGSGAPHQLRRAQFHNVHPFRDFTLDLSALRPEDLLVAITGENGAGKSTCLEVAFPGALYRDTPTHGTLLSLATDRDAWCSSTFVSDGQEITIRHELDPGGASKNSRAFVTENGARALADEKVSTFDAWAARRFVPPEVLFASMFAVQGAAGFLGATEGDRKAIILRAVGCEYLEDLAKRANAHASKVSAELVTLGARIEDERKRGGDLDALELAVEQCATASTNADGGLVEARAALERGQEQERAAVARAERAEQTLAQRAELASRLSAERKAAADLEEKIRNNRMVLEQAQQIREAAAAVERLPPQIAALETEIATSEAHRVAEGAAWKRHDAAARAADGRVDLASTRARRARDRLADREKIAAALAAVPDLEDALQRAQCAEVEADVALERARGERLASSDDRIVSLRGGHETLVRIYTEEEASRAELVGCAEDALSADDEAVRLAKELPSRLKAAEEASRAAKVAEANAVRALTEARTLAARAPDLEAAEREATEAEQEATRETGLAAGDRALGAAAAERAKGLDAARRDAQEARVALSKTLDGSRKLAARAEPLALAEARLADYAPACAALLVECFRLESELQGVPEPEMVGVPVWDPPLEELVARAERTVKLATAAAAAAEQRLEDSRAAFARLVDLEAERATKDAALADWLRLAADLGRDGLQAAEVDQAGPELTELTNDLLWNCLGPRWTIKISTTRLDAAGKRLLEDCQVTVLDTKSGREADGKKFSGGERVLIGEAVSLALTMLSCRRFRLEGVTLIRDETGAGLDPAKARVYIAMLRRAALQAKASRVLFVTHVQAVQDLADVQIPIGEPEIAEDDQALGAVAAE